MAEKKYYKQNTQKMTVTIDLSVKPTAAEEHIVKMLVAAGYKLLVKSEARAAKAKERAAAQLKDSDIIEALKDDKKNLEEYKKIKNASGFFAARSWYKKTFNK